MLLAVDNIDDGSGVNIGTGRLTTFSEVARIFGRLAGYEARVKPVIDRPVGVQSRYADTAGMESRLNWRPTTSIEDGFSLVLENARRRVATHASRV